MSRENRKSERHNIKRYAHVEVQMPCVLSDISLHGAQLEMPNADSLPDKFVIALGSDLRRWCEVKWRAAEKVGIQFIEDPATTKAWLD
jgi:hypothetical protein